MNARKKRWRWNPIAGHCPRTGKQCHKSRATAKAQREAMRKQNVHAEFDVYRCVHCGFFHIGNARKAA